MKRILACILLLTCVTPAFAGEPADAPDAVRIHLPLEGFYRPGQYIPVSLHARIPGAATGDTLILSADGAMPVHILLDSGAAAGTLPFLILDQPRRAAWSVRRPDGSTLTSGRIDIEWRRLEPTQRLVASPTGDISAARQFLGPGPIIPIRLNDLDPLNTPAAAWECLDALILDGNSAQGADRAITALISSGVTVISPQPLKSRAPWRQIGSVHVADHPIAGPIASTDWSAALSAVQGWQADWPPAFRRRIFLFATGFAVLALATTLLRRRSLQVLSILLLSILTCVGLALWWKNRSPILERQGTIIIARPELRLAQFDSWRFLASAYPAQAQVTWVAPTHLFFESRDQRQAAAPHLECAATGHPIALHLRLAPGIKAGLLTRSIQLAPNPANTRNPATSELSLQASRLYLHDGLEIAGSLPSAPGSSSATLTQWPPLILQAP